MEKLSQPMKDPRPVPTPARKLLDVLWQAPLWAVPFAFFFGTLYGSRWPDYLLTYKMSLILAYCISLAIWGVKRVMIPRFIGCDYDDERRRMNWQIGLYISGACLVASYVGVFIIHFTILPGFMGSPRAVIVSGMFAAVFTALFGGINYAIIFYRQAMERARAVEQVRADLAEAELRALRAQINPHFLFNTLNSIASLIHDDPPAAEDITTRLADVFRYSLLASERETTRFADELEFLRAYLAIERTRLGDRLKIEEDLEPGLESVPVPSLLLQPVVENAVHHGVSPRPQGGTLGLRARRAGEALVIEISDDGPGFDPAARPSGNGFGLHAVRERLRLAGPPHAIEIETAPGRGTRVRITLPIQPGRPVAAPRTDSPTRGVTT